MNRNFKRMLLLLLALLMSISGACSETVHVVCTMFPQYDFCRSIVGEETERVRLTLLMDSGVDLHNYQPAAKDIAAVADSDLLICVGGESDEWVSDALAAVHRQTLPVVRMMDCVQVRYPETGAHAHDHEHAHDHGAQPDEHVWLSLKNAVSICEAITKALCGLDVDKAAVYRANCVAYTDQLKALDARYEAVVKRAERDTLLVADRFPFLYLAADYGLKHHAAFSGCSAESEASFETVAKLIRQVNDLKLETILVTESSDQALARTICTGSEQQPDILVMNAIQTISRSDLEAGVSYLSLMEENLEVLRIALDAPEECE